MPVAIRIPTPLRTFSKGRDVVSVEGASLREALTGLENECPGIGARILDARGDVRRFVNLFVNDTDIRTLSGLESPVKDGDSISIVPAIAGGALTAQELMSQLRQKVTEVTPAAVDEERKADSGAMLIDVREKDEHEQGAIPGAHHIPRGFLELRIENLVPDRSRKIIAYCAGGNRSLLAAESLQRMGYEKVTSMAGGFNRWKNEGREYKVPRALSAAEQRRYSRHLLIPEVGEAGQIKLLDSKVLLIGAGGIGSPAAFYLAAAGVGTLGLVDFDKVDESNLQRQILHTTERVGTSKVESAKKTLLSLNPGITINGFEERLHSGNVERIFAGYDIVVDGSDNFPTRYLVNDACVMLKIPNVHGSVYRFEGQVTVYDPPRGPCYRCLYPEPPPPELAPSCAEAGVLGILPGVVGLLQAVETIKILLGAGAPLHGKLLHYDALRAEFRTLRVGRDPECAYCGEGAKFPGFIDYEQFCSSSSAH